MTERVVIECDRCGDAIPDTDNPLMVTVANRGPGPALHDPTRHYCSRKPPGGGQSCRDIIYATLNEKVGP